LEVRAARLVGGYVLQITGQVYDRRPLSGVPRIACMSSMYAWEYVGPGLKGAFVGGAFNGKNIDIRHGNVSLDSSTLAYG
jgi:hypothetical protein